MSRNGKTRKYEVGDRFVLRGEIINRSESVFDVYTVRLEDGSERVFYLSDAMLRCGEITPAPLKVGDAVRTVGGRYTIGTIEALSEGEAWVRRGTGDHITHHVNTIERVSQ